MGTFIGNGTAESASVGTTEIHEVIAKSSSLSVTGGIFKNKTTGKGTVAFLKENDPYMWEDASGGMYQIVPTVARVDDVPAEGEYTKYATFQEAAAAAVQNDKVLTLLRAPDSGDTYTLTEDDVLKVRDMGFTPTVLPEDGVTVTEEGDIKIYQLAPPTKYTVTYKVVNGTWSDGTKEPKTEEVE